MANLEYDIPITPTSIFHVASVSKQFTAMCIVLLAQDGKLSVDDEIHVISLDQIRRGEAFASQLMARVCNT
jgi:hypothetical protein